jgi:hypothetical protein
MNLGFPENLSVIQVIQLILAPGVMINACGLLLLGISNKFTSVLNRIRALTDERRKLIHNSSEREIRPSENTRIESITRQVSGLLSRARLIRNAVLCYLIAVGLFLVTSLFIGAEFFVPMTELRILILSAFLSGMIFVFIGVAIVVLDTAKGYNIVKYEVEVNE